MKIKRILLSIFALVGIISAGLTGCSHQSDVAARDKDWSIQRDTTTDFSSDLFTDTRGIKVIKTSDGNDIDLYHGSYALVIGNGNYRNGWDPLPGAVDDVKEVAEALGRYGFNVTLKTDLTRDAFSQTLIEFSEKYGRNKDSQLLIYYAGHGYTREMANGEELGYLVMVDAPLPEKDPVGFSTRAVDMQVIVTQAKMIQSRHVLFMFDSCFSGTLLSMRERVVPKSISDSVKYPVRQFITAGRANEPVPDHSVFKQAFLDLLEGRDKEPIADGYITGEELGLYLKNKVPEYNPAQHPQYGKIRDPKLDKGNFVFAFNTANRWSIKQRVLEEELKRLEAETDKASELEAKRKAEELERKIAEAKHRRRKQEELNRLEAKAERAEAKARELEANRKKEELERRIAEAKRKSIEQSRTRTGRGNLRRNFP